MKENKQNPDDKQAELQKYRDLILATLDYYIENKEMQIKNADFDSKVHYKALKIQTEEHFQNGRLSRLKQWFLELTEMQIETCNLKFNKYLQDKTRYDIDIFKSYFKRVDNIIQKGKITTDNQFYDISIMVDQLSQTDPVNSKIGILNSLLRDYEQRKSPRTKKK